MQLTVSSRKPSTFGYVELFFAGLQFPMKIWENKYNPDPDGPKEHNPIYDVQVGQVLYTKKDALDTKVSKYGTEFKVPADLEIFGTPLPMPTVVNPILAATPNIQKPDYEAIEAKKQSAIQANREKTEAFYTGFLESLSNILANDRIVREQLNTQFKETIERFINVIKKVPTDIVVKEAKTK
jgi:hypothetical protein